MKNCGVKMYKIKNIRERKNDRVGVRKIMNLL